MNSSLKTGDLQKRFAAAFMPNYGLPPLALTSGAGVHVTDADGRTYLDFIGGIAVTSLGHAHPAVVEAVAGQVASIAHTSNLFLNEPEIKLAERLLALVGSPARVFLANSGTEANECALKLAIKYGKTHGRPYVVAMENGFHGRTLGALSLTGKPSIRDQFGPFPVDVRFVPFGDADALKDAVTSECAAVFIEPTQGEAGVVPPPAGYLTAAREICDASGALLVLDEIQSAIGRTGAWFAHQHEGVVPDVLTLAKGLGGGMPIGACLAFGEHGEIFAKGDHGSTFGGNPVSAAAALAVLDTIDADGLLANAAEVGEYLTTAILALGHPSIAGVRGQGMWKAVVLTDEAAPALEAALRAEGVLANALRPDAVRLAPALIATREDVDSFIRALTAALTACYPPGGRP